MKRFSKIRLWIKNEIFHVIPVFVFFFISFFAINGAEKLIFESMGYHPFSFFEIILAAALVAKILLVIDHLPFTNLFLRKPLIFNVLWKTFLYSSVSALIRLSVRLFPFLFTNESLMQELEKFNQQMTWNLFFGIMFFYLMLFFIFVTARELTTALGSNKLRKLFFGH